MTKRRANGEGTIRKRKDDVWEARFTVNGERRSIYGKSQGEVKKKLQETLVDIANMDYLKESDITYEQWADVWMDTWLESVTESSKVKYKKNIKNHILPVIGKVKLKDLMPSHAQKVLKVAKDKGLAESTVSTIRIVMNRTLNCAVSNGLIKRNPCTKEVKVPAYSEPRREMRSLKDNEINIFLNAISGHKFEYLYYVDLFTGMRESELIGLTWDCINFEEGTIRLYRQYIQPYEKGDSYKFTQLKNKKERTFSVAPSVLELLKNIKKKQAAQKLLAGAMWQNKEGFVFTNEIGQPILQATLIWNLKRIAASIGIPELRFHDLRHH